MYLTDLPKRDVTVFDTSELGSKKKKNGQEFSKRRKVFKELAKESK